MLLSSNISKLGNIRSFNLPAIKTCPGATKQCVKYCYARKGNFKFEAVQDMYTENLKLSLSENFVEEMDKELSSNERYFRIHSSGDFYSVDYYRKWVKIARYNPHIIFLAFTRNTDIDFSEAPENLILIFTADDSTEKLNPTATRFAFVVNSGFSRIPHMTDINFSHYIAAKVCNSKSCESCLECWNGESHILFPQKYQKYSSVSSTSSFVLSLPVNS